MKEYSGSCHCGGVKYKFFSKELVELFQKFDKILKKFFIFNE